MARARTKPKDEWANRSQPIDEDMRFQRWSWRVQTAGWIALSLLALAALLGVFSNGWLSWTSAGSAEAGLAIRYQTVYRSETQAWIDLDVAGNGAGEQEILLSASLLDRLSFTTIRPPPLRAETHPDGLHLVFALAAEGTSKIRLTFRPHESGRVEGTIARAKGAAVPLSFFILP